MDVTCFPMCPPGSAGGADTATEIAQQPALWEALAQDLSRARDRLQAFLGGSLNDPNQRVLFTGAGSSGFIAEMVADAINAQWPRCAWCTPPAC